MDYTMVGGTVNLASRLEHEVPPGGVLISFETYALVKDEVCCEERGYVQVKGIAQPVATYEVVGPKPEQPTTAHLRLDLMSPACPMTSASRPLKHCVARSDYSKMVQTVGGERKKSQSERRTNGAAD